MTARLAGATALALAAVGAGCGGEEGVSTPDASAAAEPGAFPVTVEHQHGETEIAEEPERIVTVGLRDQDFALALGVVPVGTTEWFGDQPGAVWPWARDELGKTEPEVVGEFSDLNYEQIAALRPDLILGIYSGMSERAYDTLSKIAPTVADSPEYPDYSMPWEEQLRMTGLALGRPDAAAEIERDLAERIRAAREAHPQLAGKTAIYGGLGGAPGAYTSVDQRGRFLEALGLDVPDEIDELAAANSRYWAQFSKERYRLFDQDVAIIVGPSNRARDFIADEPLYGRLDAVREGRVVFVDEIEGTLSGALSFDSPLSIPYALKELPPRLVAAADGDPATAVQPTPSIEDF